MRDDVKKRFEQLFGYDYARGEAHVRTLIKRGVSMGKNMNEVFPAGATFDGMEVQLSSKTSMKDRDFLMLAFFALAGMGAFDQLGLPLELPAPDPIPSSAGRQFSVMMQNVKNQSTPPLRSERSEQIIGRHRRCTCTTPGDLSVVVADRPTHIDPACPLHGSDKPRWPGPLIIDYKSVTPGLKEPAGEFDPQRLAYPKYPPTPRFMIQAGDSVAGVELQPGNWTVEEIAQQIRDSGSGWDAEVVSPTCIKPIPPVPKMSVTIVSMKPTTPDAFDDDDIPRFDPASDDGEVNADETGAK